MTVRALFYLKLRVIERSNYFASTCIPTPLRGVGAGGGGNVDPGVH